MQMRVEVIGKESVKELPPLDQIWTVSDFYSVREYALDEKHRMNC